MPRAPRELVAGGYYHVVDRGVERRSLFLDDADRERFLGLLGVVVRRRDWSCLAYCLMGNHYHLLVRTPEPDLPVGLHELNWKYARWFNDRHDRDGHLFRGRYKAWRIRREQHLFATTRYIAMNPVRAGLCVRPEDWRWSSHRATIGAVPAGFVDVEELHSLCVAAFGAPPQAIAEAAGDRHWTNVDGVARVELLGSSGA